MHTPTTIKKPPTNAIMERLDDVLWDMLHTKNLHKCTFDIVDPWSELLTSVAYDIICNTHHNILKASPIQLVFSYEILLNVYFIAYWHAIRMRKQQSADKNNNKENNLC